MTRGLAQRLVFVSGSSTLPEPEERESLYQKVEEKVAERADMKTRRFVAMVHELIMKVGRDASKRYYMPFEV